MVSWWQNRREPNVDSTVMGSSENRPLDAIVGAQDCSRDDKVIIPYDNSSLTMLEQMPTIPLAMAAH